MELTVTLTGNMAFTAEAPSGSTFTMDAYPDSGGEGLGPTPLEAFMASAAACSAMDVIMILRKKKQNVTSYKVEFKGERAPYGSEYPRPFTAIEIKHILEGENLDANAVARAVELSDQKYCTVIATLRQTPPVTSTFELLETAPR